MPLDKTFWVEAFGMLVDKYGTPWMVGGGKQSLEKSKGTRPFILRRTRLITYMKGASLQFQERGAVGPSSLT